MKMLYNLIEKIMDELEGAKEYAEKHIDSKARGNVGRAEKYAEMARDELKHAGYMREFATADIEEIKRVYKLPEEFEEEWEHAHKKMLECMAIVRQMLSL